MIMNRIKFHGKNLHWEKCCSFQYVLGFVPLHFYLDGQETAYFYTHFEIYAKHTHTHTHTYTHISDFNFISKEIINRILIANGFMIRRGA